MADCAPTARVPASTEILIASPEAKEVNPQHRPAARGGKPTAGGVTSAHIGCAHFSIQDNSNINETVDIEDTGHKDWKISFISSSGHHDSLSGFGGSVSTPKV